MAPPIYPFRGIFRRAFAVAVLLGAYALAVKAQAPEENLLAPGAQLASGVYWGKGSVEAAKRLGFPSSRHAAGLYPERHFREALLKLWKADRDGAFEHVRLSSAAFLLSHEGRLWGAVERVPVGSWEQREVAVRRRFGEPEKIHFTVDAATGAFEASRFYHVYLWRGGETLYLFLKPTLRDNSSVWLDQELDAIGRVRILQKAEDPGTPLYVAVFAAEAVRSLEGFYHSHKGGPEHFHEAGHTHGKDGGPSLPAYLQPLTPATTSVK